MNRRAFGIMTTAFIMMPFSLSAYSYVRFSPEKWAELQSSDHAVILNFRAQWSFTCERNLEVMAHLLKQNQAYQNLTFVDIDWDIYGQSILASKLKVQRQSTLLALKRGVEIARLVNQPYERDMRRFFDLALRA